ncbi:MAG: DUF2167 domain-containing protein [Pseudomonadota bacterium]
MFRYASVLSLVAFSLLAAPSAVAQEAEELTEAQQIYANLEFSAGPGTFDVSSRAEIDLPEGYDRLNAEDTAKLMALYENPTSTNEYYVAPTDERWFSVFSYDDTGHIKDDEEIDAGDLLSSIREGTEYSNRERRDRGWPEMTIVGWQSQPSYSDATNRLSWAIIGESAGQQIVNYNTRLLGRTGVMSATLVAAPDELDTAIAEFETMLEGFRYKPGNLYAEYKEGEARHLWSGRTRHGRCRRCCRQRRRQGPVQGDWLGHPRVLRLLRSHLQEAVLTQHRECLTIYCSERTCWSSGWRSRCTSLTAAA